jgi:cell division protein FtsI/penicillin-binding protein 2
MQNSLPRIRIILIGVGILILSLVIIIRLFMLQVLHHSEYVEKGKKQYSTFQGDAFDRGAIYFTAKDGTRVLAAATTVGYKLAITPKLVAPKKDEIYEKLNAITPIDKATFLQKVARTDDPYEEIAYKLNQDQAQAVRALKFTGVDVFNQSWRFYPGENLASRLLGFVSYQGDKLSGRYGLERQYDAVLVRNQKQSYSNFFAEVFNTIRGIVSSPGEEEGSLVTTIEPTVQAHIEETLRTMSDKYHPSEVGAIVMNPKNGEIIAMAVLPDYNVNEFNKVDNVSIFNNPIVENVYELGSVVKSLTMSSGLDAGVVTPETTYNDKGYIILNTERINNFDKKARGIVTMQDVLNNSLNTGATFVMQQLGRERFKNYMLSFGIGEKTGVDVPGEVKSLIGNLKSTRDLEYATASFGQGIALTPIAAIRAFASLANGGYIITPHVVRAIEHTDGTVHTLSFPEPKQVLKKETTETISRMLTTVIDKGMFGGRAKLAHYSVAAKTGTAQVARPDGKGYYDDIFLHSMFGYYPAYDPQFITLFYIVDPKGVEYALNTLGHSFMDTASFLMTYYEVAPDR